MIAASRRSFAVASKAFSRPDSNHEAKPPDIRCHPTCTSGRPRMLDARKAAPISGCMIHQLRIYEIFERNKAAFHARFRDHAARIMRRHGFDIVAMWEARTERRTEFVYLLAWPDEAAKDAAWR